MKTVIFPEVLVRAAQLEGGRLEGAGLTVGELLAGLARKHPSLLGHLYYENGQLKEHFLLTHKGSLVNLDGELSDGDEVEVMLATSGGSGVEALSDEEVQRYVRHITLPGVGREGQQRLKQARVLIIGTGGLGSPACLYLAAAGVGTIGLVDFDVVESSNLQRQVVHGYSTLGMPKVESAQRRMQDLNPYIEVVTHRYAIDADNAQSLIQSYDLVLDGTDNFATRYLVNAVCAKLGKGKYLSGRLLRFDALLMHFNEVKFNRRDDCPACGKTAAENPRHWREGLLCQASAAPSQRLDDDRYIDPGCLLQLMKSNSENYALLDVRDAGELEVCQLPGIVHVPLNELASHFANLDFSKRYILVCYAGTRAERAAIQLMGAGFSNVQVLDGGMKRWAKEIEQHMPMY